MCDHKFIILTTSELETIILVKGNPASVKACLKCGELRFKPKNGKMGYSVSDIFSNYQGGTFGTSHYVERLMLFSGDWATTQIGT